MDMGLIGGSTAVATSGQPDERFTPIFDGFQSEAAILIMAGILIVVLFYQSKRK